MPLSPNERVGPYELIEMLGSGGFATVWRARAIGGTEEVAIKVLHESLLGQRRPRGPSVAQRFIEEGELLARLRSPGLVEILDVIDDRNSGLVALIMERLTGEDLSQIGPRLDIEDLIEVFAQVAFTLDHLHGHGVVHRDVKPSNIFVCDDARVVQAKLLDLGVAKDLVMSTVRESTARGDIVGSVHNLAPETVARINGEAVPVTPPLDQWGLGVSLYEMLSGRSPIEFEGLFQLMEALANLHIVPLALLPRFGIPGTPDAIAVAVQRLLAARPEDRFSNMRDVAAALRDAGAEIRQLRLTSGQKTNVVGHSMRPGTEASLLNVPREPATATDLPAIGGSDLEEGDQDVATQAMVRVTSHLRTPKVPLASLDDPTLGDEDLQPLAAKPPRRLEDHPTMPPRPIPQGRSSAVLKPAPRDNLVELANARAGIPDRGATPSVPSSRPAPPSSTPPPPVRAPGPPAWQLMIIVALVSAVVGVVLGWILRGA